MNAYVDTSVLLRVVLAQPEPLAEWTEITRPISSELIRVESLRAADRARFERTLTDAQAVELRGRVFERLAGFDFLVVDRWVLARAEDPFPTPLSSLDAIHLSSALLARMQLGSLSLATHDEQLAAAGRAMGFDVIGA